MSKLDALNLVMNAESVAKKYTIIGFGACFLVGYAVIGGLYAARWANVD